MSFKPFVALILTAWIGFAAPAGAVAPPPAPAPAPARAEKLSNRAIYNKAVHATALVIHRDKTGGGSGTGWIVDAKRKLIVTNYHVAPGTTVEVIFPIFKDGRAVANRLNYPEKGAPAVVIDSDPKIDLAILQVKDIPEGMHELPLAAEEPLPGDNLHLVGNPGASRGLWVYTTGTLRQMVQFTSRLSNGQAIDARVGENQMSINGGDSGSAILNDEGEVVGINFASNFDPKIKNFSFFIALSELKVFLADVVVFLESEQIQPATYERRAERLIRKGRGAEGMADLNKAIELDPKRGTAYKLRARQKYTQRLYDAALSDAYKAVELLPGDGLVYNERGNAHFSRGDYKRAIADYTKAMELMPKDPVVMVNRGRAHAFRKELAEALRDYNRAVVTDPRSIYALETRGRLLREQKQYARAIADFRAGLNVLPNDSILLVDLADTLKANRDLAQAAAAYTEALKVQPANPALVWQQLGDVRHALGQHEEALAALNESIRLNPRNAQAWALRGLTLEAKGDVEDAQTDYSKAIELDRSLERLLPRFKARQVKVTNNTAETLEVFVRFEEPGSGKAGAWVLYTVGAGSTLALYHEGKPIEASRLRIWAKGMKTGKKFDTLKDRDIVLVEGTYRATKIDSHIHRFGD